MSTPSGYLRVWRERNKDKVASYEARRVLSGKKALSEKKRYAKHKEKILARKKKWYWNNLEKVRAYSRKWYAENRSWVKERDRGSYSKKRSTPGGAYRIYKSSAKRAGKDFRLTLDEFSLFWQKECHYCGDSVPTIGLDRMDSEKGYFLGNVVSCCWRCNRAKTAMGIKDFISMCMKVAKRHGVLK